MAERHRIPVTDGESVVAVHHPAPTDEWLVFCHGFLSDKSGSYESRCERAVEEGYNAVRFDFRGCGEADGEFVAQTIASKLADLRAVVAHFDPDSYALFGSSFGGKVALHAAADDDRVWAVVTRSPVTLNEAFDDYRDLVAEAGRVELAPDMAIDDHFFEVFETYPFDDVVEALDCPVAMVHGAADTVVPVEYTFDAAAALETDVLLEKLTGEAHNFSRPGEARFRDRAFDWLASVRRRRGSA
jgi:pimeloyl-ACP methyl ester carboxylesterase